MNIEHQIVECMASGWDEAGHQSPYNWRFVCSCGHQERGFRDQIQVMDAFRAHKNEATS